MISVLAVVSMILLTVAAAAVFIVRGRRRDLTVSYLDNVSVSRQWLMQHQADDRS
jgi:hypothetical protein